MRNPPRPQHTHRRRRSLPGLDVVRRVESAARGGGETSKHRMQRRLGSGHKHAIFAPAAVMALSLALVAGVSWGAPPQDSSNSSRPRATATVTKTVTATATVTMAGPTMWATATATVPGPTSTVTVPGPTKTVTAAGPTSTVTVPGPTTTVTVTGAPTSAPPTTGAPTSSPPTTGAPTSTATATATATATPPGGVSCTSPVWTGTQNGDMWSSGKYIVHNNMWNAASYGVQQTTKVCNYNNWYSVATANNNSGDGAVKTYPNVHVDYHNWSTGVEPQISSFSTITSRFAHKSPGAVGIYNFAYDLWLNGVADTNSTELMIWTENYRQVPSGSKVGQVTISGVTWDVWSASSNHYLAFVPVNGGVVTSGTLDLKAFMTYLVSNGRLAASSTLGQICYGVEIVSTDAKPGTFGFTDFAVTTA
jgi:hypothetical protein